LVPPKPKLFVRVASRSFSTAVFAVKSRPRAAHAGSTFSRLVVGGMTPFSSARMAASAPRAQAPQA
jgi:hypothetical protein